MDTNLSSEQHQPQFTLRTQLAEQRKRQRAEFDQRKDSEIPTLSLKGAGIDIGHRMTFSLRNVSIDLYPKEIGIVVGRNGSGKSTLLELVAGLRKCTSGTIAYPGISPSRDWREIRSQIRYLSQDFSGWGPGSFEEALHLRVLAASEQTTDVEEDCNWIIHNYELSEHRKKHFHQLSGGYRVRAMLALAVAARAKLIILDEPMAPLDIVAQYSFLNILSSIVEKGNISPSVLVASQHLDELEFLADKIIFLQNGEPKQIISPLNQDCSTFETLSIPNNDIELFRSRLDREFQMSTEESGIYLVHYFDREVSLGEMAQMLTSNGINLRHIRDLSGSVRLLFKQ